MFTNSVVEIADRQHGAKPLRVRGEGRFGIREQSIEMAVHTRDRRRETRERSGGNGGRAILTIGG